MNYYLGILGFILLAFSFESEGKQFTRCELVRELRKNGFPSDKLADWVCLVEHESSRKTDKIGRVNKNGSQDFGLFQINDKYWCTNSAKTSDQKDCHVTCAEVTTDDITKACTCAKKVYKRHGFKAWYGWKDHCQTPGSLPDISNC